MFRCLYLFCNILIKAYCTIIGRLKLSLWQVEYESHLSIRGRIIVYKYPGSLIKIGRNCTFNSLSRFNFRGINHPCILQTGKNGHVIIGDYCGFSGVSIVSSCKVEIGDYVICGANVIIGDRNDHEDVYSQFQPAPVVIGNHVWLGMNVVVMKGVKIGDNTIIGANSIVTKDIPANVIAAGNPCKVVKNVESISNY